MKSVSAMLLILAVAIIVITLGLLVISNVFGFEYEATKEAAKKIGETGDVTYTTPIFKDPFEVDTLDHILPLNPWDPFQPSEIACYIADIIYNDYSAKGKDIPRIVEDNCWDRSLLSADVAEECFISEPKIFTLTEGEDNPAFDEEDILYNNPDYGPCHFCQEGGTPIPLLDETCMNFQLRDRKVVDDDFCNDPFFPLGGTPGEGTVPSVEFGNKDCFVPDINKQGALADWENHCQGGDNDGNWPDPIFCDNSLNYVYNWNEWWVADCASGESYCYPSGEADPREIVSDKHRNDPKGILDHDERRYIFGVAWIHDDEKYNVLFARVPHITLETSILDRIDDIVDRNNKIVRYNDLGWLTWYGRKTADFLVRDDDTTINEIIQRIGEKAELDYIATEKCDEMNKDQREGRQESEGCVFFGVVRVTGCPDWGWTSHLFSTH